MTLSLPVVGLVDFMSIYGSTYVEADALQLAATALEGLAASGKPGVLAGDFNLSPGLVSELIVRLGLEGSWQLVAPLEATCVQGRHSSTLDFFIVHVSLRPLLGDLEVESCWTWAPHKPVRLDVRVSGPNAEQRVLRAAGVRPALGGPGALLWLPARPGVLGQGLR